MWTFILGSSPLTRVVASRLLWSGLFFLLVGILILLFPQLLAIPVALLSLLIGASLVSAGVRAWIVWHRLRRQQDAQDASWYDVE